MGKSDEEDAADSWGTALDGREAPAVGVNIETLRTALKLNPSLKNGQNTTDILAQVSAAQSARSVAVPNAKAAAKPRARDVVEAFLQAKEKFDDDKKRLQEARAVIDAEEKQLAPKVLERLIDVVLELDPNMTSPQTQDILKLQGQFLQQVGFSSRKVTERKMKNRT